MRAVILTTAILLLSFGIVPNAHAVTCSVTQATTEFIEMDRGGAVRVRPRLCATEKNVPSLRSRSITLRACLSGLIQS